MSEPKFSDMSYAQIKLRYLQHLPPGDSNKICFALRSTRRYGIAEAQVERYLQAAASEQRGVESYRTFFSQLGVDAAEKQVGIQARQRRSSCTFAAVGEGFDRVVAGQLTLMLNAGQITSQRADHLRSYISENSLDRQQALRLLKGVAREAGFCGGGDQ